jgi:RNA polymerase sigma-70 factor, ECF subfamily
MQAKIISRRSAVEDHGRAAIPERELCEHLRLGDAEAFRQLVRQHHASMISLARSFVATRATAEEVVQDAWLAVIEGLDSFEQRSSLKAWICSILVNKARTRAVRDKRMMVFSDFASPDEANGPAVDPSHFNAAGYWTDLPRLWDELDPERVVAGRQLWRHLASAIDELPPGQRAVIIMRDVEGHGSEETCRILGVSEGNQRVLLHRARAKLRQAIDRLLAGPAERDRHH